MLIARGGEPVDGYADLAGVRATQPAQHRTSEDAKPHFDLVEPGGARSGVWWKCTLGSRAHPAKPQNLPIMKRGSP